MIVSITEVIVVVLAGFLFAVLVFFGSSFLYFIFMHRNGTADYAAKTISIGFLTIPVAILLSLMLIFKGVGWVVHKVVQVLGAAWQCLRRSKGTDSSHGEEAADTTDVTVHLVHGTFEPNASWTLPGSKMRDAIEGMGCQVNVARFSWSGHNSPAARSQAAEELAKKVIASPSRRHYIVAHSHGGNIVREMSHLFPETAPKISGVCLLSPPFIFRRMITRTAGSFILMNGIGFMLAVQIPIAALLLPFGLYWPYGAIGTSVVALLVEVWLSKYCSRSYAKEIEVEHETVAFRDVQIYHAIGDEADSALRFVSFLHETCFGILSQLKAAAKLAKTKINLPYLTSYAFFIGVIGYLYLIGAQSTLTVWVAISLVGLGLILGAHIVQFFRPSKDDPQILVAAALPIVMFSFWLAAAKAMAYGDWRLIFCPEIFISSSETPEGDHQVLKFAPRGDGVMVHSTHSHPLAVQNVASWLDWSLGKDQSGLKPY